MDYFWRTYVGHTDMKLLYSLLFCSTLTKHKNYSTSYSAWYCG